MTNLVESIDSAVAFVRKCGQEMARSEMNQFHELAQRVYVLAFEAGLDGALPQVAELKPQVESLGLPPVQFESKLNLPGDWEPLRTLTDKGNFLVGRAPRWFDDMDTLRLLAQKYIDIELTKANRPLKKCATDFASASQHRETLISKPLSPPVADGLVEKKVFQRVVKGRDDREKTDSSDSSEPQWSKEMYKSEWREILNISPSTWRRYVTKGDLVLDVKGNQKRCRISMKSLKKRLGKQAEDYL